MDELTRATHVFCDGVSVLMLARIQGKPVPKRVPGPTVMPAVCEYGQDRGYRHFFLGGAPGVADDLVTRFKERYPNIEVAGTYSPPFGPFSSEEDARICQAVNDAKPDLLWVGLGAPRQEHWIASHRDLLSVPVILGVGAAFDFHTGKQRWAPLWIRKLGMEWAFRMVTDGPGRFVKNARFVSVMFLALGAAVIERISGKHRLAS